MPTDQGPVFVVIYSCGVQHTYNVGPSSASFLGKGDLHDPSYTDLAVQGSLGVFTSGRMGTSIFCDHQLFVYPSAGHENVYEGESPYVFAVGSASCFFFAICLFLFYDGYVRVQQNRVVGHAERSQALVASLFPTSVARRLFESNRSTASGVLDQSNHSAHLLNFVTKSDRSLLGNPSSMDERPIAEL